VFLDESGFMLQPLRRRTWAPRGQTPIHRAWRRHDRLSVLAALTLSPLQKRIGIYLSYQQENFRAPSVVQFVRHLHRQLGCKLILVWDRWSVHRSAARELLHNTPAWLQIEWLPSYAPELNPVEAMWSYTKHGQLANFLPDDIQDLEDAVVESISDQHYDTKLKQSFFQTAQLDL